MNTVGGRELKNRLTHCLARAKRGEDVVVTERGRPVAVLRPIHCTDQPQSLEAQLARLAAQGLVVLPTRKPLKRVRRVKIDGPPLSKAILEDRR